MSAYQCRSRGTQSAAVRVSFLASDSSVSPLLAHQCLGTVRGHASLAGVPPHRPRHALPLLATRALLGPSTWWVLTNLLDSTTRCFITKYWQTKSTLLKISCISAVQNTVEHHIWLWHNRLHGVTHLVNHELFPLKSVLNSVRILKRERNDTLGAALCMPQPVAFDHNRSRRRLTRFQLSRYLLNHCLLHKCVF